MTDLPPTVIEFAAARPARYGAAVARLLDLFPPCQLGPGTAADPRLRRTLRELLDPFADPDLADSSHASADHASAGQPSAAPSSAAQPIVDRRAAACCRAGLWLAGDFLDESHTISQSIETPSGSYWHGLMHRREPDPDNAKYWFRRVRCHPIFESLAAAARAATLNAATLNAAATAGIAAGPTAFLATQTVWDPFRFVDLCERFRGAGDSGERLCREIAWIEWRLLFDYCHRQALGLE